MVVTSYHNTAASNMLTDAMTGFEMNEGMLDDNTGTFGLGYDGARAKRKMVEGGGGKSRTGRSNTGRSAKASKSAKSKKKSHRRTTARMMTTVATMATRTTTMAVFTQACLSEALRRRTTVPHHRITPPHLHRNRLSPRPVAFSRHHSIVTSRAGLD